MKLYVFFQIGWILGKILSCAFWSKTLSQINSKTNRRCSSHEDSLQKQDLSCSMSTLYTCTNSTKIYLVNFTACYKSLVFWFFVDGSVTGAGLFKMPMSSEYLKTSNKIYKRSLLIRLRHFSTSIVALPVMRLSVMKFLESVSHPGYTVRPRFMHRSQP